MTAQDDVYGQPPPAEWLPPASFRRSIDARLEPTGQVCGREHRRPDLLATREHRDGQCFNTSASAVISFAPLNQIERGATKKHAPAIGCRVQGVVQQLPRQASRSCGCF
ncbi:unnamed protein product [Prorocentrum cordatum]|uniref:Uncharacterized protein n=1 Tax=Prorocentrum cordatum TaxID=2364126 RepID=A0ABN9X079_9DINO|nr:unnamed protein product [Polarella glacialis]